MILTALFTLLSMPASEAAAAAALPPAVTLSGHRSTAFFLSFPGPELLISASADSVRIWNPATGETIKEIPGTELTAAAYCGTLGLLAVARRDSTVIVYSSGTWEEKARPYNPGPQALSLAFSRDSALIAAAGQDGRVRAWKTADWKPAFDLAASRNSFTLAGFSGSGNLLATFTRDEPLLRIWDLKTKKLLYWLKSPHTLSAFFDPRGHRLAAIGADRTLRVWEPGIVSAPAPGELPVGPVCAAAFSAAGGLLAAAGLDGSITVWNTDRAAKAGEIRDSRIRTLSLAFSPSGAYLAGGEAGGDIKIRLWSSEVWTSSGSVPVKNPAGGTITLLSTGTRLELLQAPRGAAHWLVSDGTGLSGWAPAAALNAERPDIFPPVIRIASQAYSNGVLNLKGLVTDDGRLEYIRFSGKELARPAGPLKASGSDSWPFEISAELTPDTVPTVETGDFSGKENSISLNLLSESADYSPGYLLLTPKDGAGIFREPKEASQLLSKASPGVVLAALGTRGSWYFLEGGGWIKTSSAAEAAPSQAPAAPLFITAGTVIGPQESPENIPRGRANPRGLAVVIGVKDYADGDIPRADYALEDARAVSRHLTGALGFDPERVLLLENPTKGQLETVFGGAGGGRLKGLIKDGESELFVYYSGHGAADPEEGAAYLVPADARPDYLRLGGFPLKQLYSSLENSGAAQITVVIEACFSGLSHAGPLLSRASPLILAAHKPQPKGLNIFSSSAADQVSSWYPAGRRGLFTYYFLKALRENCCGGVPLRLDTLREFTKAEVSAAALRLYGRIQTPLFSGNSQAALTK